MQWTRVVGDVLSSYMMAESFVGEVNLIEHSGDSIIPARSGEIINDVV
jgi:hypothetical protein